MVFSSSLFLYAFLPIALLLYYIAPKSARGYRNYILFFVSIAFYSFGESKIGLLLFVLSIMLTSSFGAYVFGLMIDKNSANKKRAKTYMILSLAFNLSFLLFFKYANFFIGNLPFLSLTPIEGLILPVGISFYTFQIMSYTIDLYRGEVEVQKNYVYFGAYVVLFPQLIAGPIVRYKEVAYDLHHRVETVEQFSSGVMRFCAGLAKKLILADSMALLAKSMGETNLHSPSVLGAWLVVAGWTFQIYFDFSGYSDMAIGLGRMLGFSFPENFNYPYISRSITDFWRRWHMTLSGWFRDYVYIPLGGNRKGLLMQYRNIAIVWLLTGFWHGAAWNYILWGVYFGVILMIEKAFLLKALERLPRIFGHLYALLLIVFGWLLFFSPDLTGIASHAKMLVGAGAAFTNPIASYELLRWLPMLVILAIASTPLPKRLFEKLGSAQKVLSPILAALALLVCTGYLADSSFSPFLYYIF